MSLAYIRATYGVPARRGSRIAFHGDGTPRAGAILGARGPHLRVRLDGERIVRTLHPTWCVTYAPAGA